MIYVLFVAKKLKGKEMNNQQSILDRRSFLRHVSSTALTLPLMGLGVVEFHKLRACDR
jgi:hypothetical protein